MTPEERSKLLGECDRRYESAAVVFEREFAAEIVELHARIDTLKSQFGAELQQRIDAHRAEKHDIHARFFVEAGSIDERAHPDIKRRYLEIVGQSAEK